MYLYKVIKHGRAIETFMGIIIYQIKIQGCQCFPEDLVVVPERGSKTSAGSPTLAPRPSQAARKSRIF
jgi:hypothetical protein